MTKEKNIDIDDNFNYLFGNGVDLKHRTIYITDHSEFYEENDGEDSSDGNAPLNYSNAIKALICLSNVDCKKPIKIIINSFGGDVYEALSLSDVINLIPNKTIAIGIGLIASGASLILAACKERYLTPSTFIMIHELSSRLSGSHTNQKNELAHQDDILICMCNKYKKIFKDKTISNIKELLKKDYYFTAEEAKDTGFVDKILYTTEDFKKVLKDND